MLISRPFIAFTTTALILLLLATALHAGQWTSTEDSKIPDQNKTTPENYCKDPSSWKQWEDLVAKYPNDSDVQTLHALRIGLCAKIEQGSITLDEAIRLFDRAHRMVLEKKLAERKKKTVCRYIPWLLVRVFVL